MKAGKAVCPQSAPCRWGLSRSLRFLRLACRAHRLEDGRLRLATDALHQSLLTGVPGVLEVPPCFHGADDWAVLVTEGVIDGAIVSSLCHHQSFRAGRLPQWEGVRAVPLATLELQLVCHQRWQGALDKGGVIVVECGGALITAYDFDSFNHY